MKLMIRSNEQSNTSKSVDTILHEFVQMQFI